MKGTVMLGEIYVASLDQTCAKKMGNQQLHVRHCMITPTISEAIRGAARRTPVDQ